MTDTDATTDDTALLRSILGNPADDTARLVYADWLDENDGARECCCVASGYAFGDTCGNRCLRTGLIRNGFAERAEFIRVQVEIARIDAGADKQRTRARELLSDFAHIWFQDAFPWAGVPEEAAYAQWWRFVERGFIGNLELPAADWLTHADAILARHPVTRVKLRTVPEHRYRRHGQLWRLIGPNEFAWRDLSYCQGWYEVVRELLRFEWPGITFELPAA